MPDAPLPALPPAGQPEWRVALAELKRRLLLFRPSYVFAGVLAVVLVVVGVVVLRPSRSTSVAGAMPTATPALAEPADPGSGPVAGRGPGSGAASGAGPGVSAKAAGKEGDDVVVDVAGAVARPGLVHLKPGMRVADAVSAAGGAAADADVAGLNQARVVADGEQVRVPRQGEPPPPAPAGAPGSPGAPPGPPAPVDLNRATPAELDTLPGVGPATATAIIAWRDKNGRFRRPEDLLDVPGIGPARLERLRPLVRV